jgi:hypothetical protein
MKAAVDHSGDVPEGVVDRGFGEERLTPEILRALAATLPPGEFREMFEGKIADLEFAHTLTQGLSLDI